MIHKDDLRDFRDWIAFTLEMLVDDADSLNVTVVPGEVVVDGVAKPRVVVSVTGPRSEMGKVIGKKGLTIEAVKRLAISIARRMDITFCDIQVAAEEAAA